VIVHIVLFNFKEDNRELNIKKVSEMLEALPDKIPTLQSMEVGINYSDAERAMDLSLISTFDNRSGLEQYAIHPEHVKVVEYIKSVVTESKVVDYEKIVN